MEGSKLPIPSKIIYTRPQHFPHPLCKRRAKTLKPSLPILPSPQLQPQHHYTLQGLGWGVGVKIPRCRGRGTLSLHTYYSRCVSGLMLLVHLSPHQPQHAAGVAVYKCPLPLYLADVGGVQSCCCNEKMISAVVCTGSVFPSSSLSFPHLPLTLPLQVQSSLPRA